MNKEIDNITIEHLNFNNGGLVAFARIKYKGLILSSIGIYEKRDGSGYRLTYPTKKRGLHDLNVFNPYDAKVSNLLEKEIIASYMESIK